jgi:hypothetical protein
MPQQAGSFPVLTGPLLKYLSELFGVLSGEVSFGTSADVPTMSSLLGRSSPPFSTGRIVSLLHKALLPEQLSFYCLL